MDDIICRAKSLSDLLGKLCIFFDIFFKYNISIKSTKSFLNYPNIGLLGQQVNFLGFTTSEKKLRAIKHLTYRETLGALEYYLSLTGYLRNYIRFYAQLAAPLQALKTFLLRNTPVSGQQRRAYTSKTKLGVPTSQKLALFQNIQDALSHPSTLLHHNPNKTLWIDLDAPKEFGFGAVVFIPLPTKTFPTDVGQAAALFSQSFTFLGFSAPWKRTIDRQSLRLRVLFE